MTVVASKYKLTGGGGGVEGVGWGGWGADKYKLGLGARALVLLLFTLRLMKFDGVSTKEYQVTCCDVLRT